MIKKKNALLTFIFSLVPGACEMYMGFMKQGLSLMTMFFACLALYSWVSIVVLIYAGIIIWCYSFFHAHNLYSLPEEEFKKVEDKIIVPFNGEDIHFNITNNKLRTLGAVAMICFGVSMLWNYVLDTLGWILPYEIYNKIWNLCYELPEAIVAVLIIWLGIRLIKGKKQQLDKQEKEQKEQKPEA